MLVLNIKDGQKPAVGSGQGMVAALRRALAVHGVPFSTSADMDIQAGFSEAQCDGYRYMLKCTITLWKDHATAWSGKGDKLNISIEMYDVQTHELMAAATDKRTATGFTPVSGSPDRFMDQVGSGTPAQIYGWPSK